MPAVTIKADGQNSGQGAATAAEALVLGSAGSAPRPRPSSAAGTPARRSTSSAATAAPAGGRRAVRRRRRRRRRRADGRTVFLEHRRPITLSGSSLPRKTEFTWQSLMFSVMPVPRLCSCLCSSR